jgi:hypothetical protein
MVGNPAEDTRLFVHFLAYRDSDSVSNTISYIADIPYKAGLRVCLFFTR